MLSSAQRGPVCFAVPSALPPPERGRGQGSAIRYGSVWPPPERNQGSCSSQVGQCIEVLSVEPVYSDHMYSDDYDSVFFDSDFLIL